MATCLKDFRFWILIALTLGYRSLFYLAAINPWLFPDSYSYSDLAQSLVSSGSFGNRVWLVPGYPVFLAIAKLLSAKQFLWIAVTFQHLLGVVSVALVYCMAVRLYQQLRGVRWWAFIAGLLYLSARFAIYDHSILADSVFTSLVICQSYFLIEYFETRQIRYAILLGVFLGFTILIKPIDQLGWLIPAATFLLFQSSWRQFGKAIIALLIPIIMIVSPWLMRNFFYFDYLGLSAYSGYQLLIRTSKLMDTELIQTRLQNTEALQGIATQPDSQTRAHLQSIASMPTPAGLSQALSVEQEYQRLLSILLSARLSEHLKALNNYSSRAVHYTFTEYYRAGFPELEVVGVIGNIAKQTLQDPQNRKRFFEESLNKHIPEMMGFKNGINLAYAKYSSYVKANQAIDPQSRPLFAKLFIQITELTFWPDIFWYLSPMALVGFLLTIVFKFQSPFSFYAFFKILYFPVVVAIFGNGFERYRLPVDHLIILGAVFLLGLIVYLCKKIKVFQF